MAQVRICPHCQLHNPAMAADCLRCASPLDMVDPVELVDPAPVAPVVAESIAGDDSLACPHADCGAANPRGASTCLYCGRLLAQAAQSFLISLPPALAARYRLCEQFPASGAEAEVFLADDLEHDRQVVLKLYRKGVRPKSEVLQRVARAARTEVIALYEHGEADGTCYEVLEHALHGSLRTLIAAGVAPALHRRIVAELASAIAHLHQLKIIHRDIKPENILVRELEPLDLAFTDFGTSSLLEFSQRLTGGHRTLRYSAPETASGLLTPKADWWSLGMVLVEVFCGRHPFDGLPDPVIMNLLFTKPVDLSVIGDPRWRALCRGLLLRDPERRWGAAEVQGWLAGADQAADDRERHGRQAGAALRVGGRDCRDLAELAQALAAQWAAAAPMPAADELQAWLRDELGDATLAADIAAFQVEPALTRDERVLKTIYRLAPDLPPLYKNLPLTGPDLIAAAQRALQDAAGACALFAEVMGGDVLRHFPDNRLLQQVRQQWAAALAESRFAWEAALAAGAPAEAQPASEIDPALFIASFSRRAAAGLASGVAAPNQHMLDEFPWCAAFAAPTALSPARLLVWRVLEPFAKRQLESRRLQAMEADLSRQEGDKRVRQLRHLQARLATRGRDTLGPVADANRQLLGQIAALLAGPPPSEAQLAAVMAEEGQLQERLVQWRRECCERWIRTLGSVVVHLKSDYAQQADKEMGNLLAEMRYHDEPELGAIIEQIETDRQPVARVARHFAVFANFGTLALLVVLARGYLWLAEAVFDWQTESSWWVAVAKNGFWLAALTLVASGAWLMQLDGPAASLKQTQARLEDWLRKTYT